MNAFIRLTLVNNSLADITPLRFSPGIPKNLGKPAPEPIKNAEYPSLRKSSIVADLPTIKLFLISML